MIDLSKFTLKVTSEYEMKVALAFYKLCTGYPQAREFGWCGSTYVGVYWRRDTFIHSITTGSPSEHETIVPMSNISDLADTVERIELLAVARATASDSISNVNHDGEI